MGTQFVGTSSLSLPDKRILKKTPLPRDRVDVVSDSTNADSGGPRSTMLRPGNILIKDTTTGKYFDDTTSGDGSTQASVASAAAAGATWASKTVELQIDGVSIVTVTLGALDDTTSEVVTALNANGAFRANAIASGADGAVVTIKSLRKGASVHLKVIGNHADVFTIAGTAARGTDGDWVVTTEYCDQLDPLGNTKDARVSAVRAGVFDEANLVWAGAAGAATIPEDAKRVMIARGAKFE